MEINPLESAYAPLHSFFKSLPWWLSLISAVGYIVLLFLIQRAVFRFLKRWALRRENRWYGFIVTALDRSLFFFLVSGSVGLIPVLFRISKDWKKTVALTAELLAILAFAVFLQTLLVAAFRRYVSRNESMRAYSGLVRTIITIVVYSIFLLIFLDTAGISITPLIASLGVGSVAIAFALQETLASLFSGLYLVTDRPIRVGDFVRLETGEEGYVESIGWRSVRIRMLPNNMVIIPNSKLAGGIITNYSLPSRELAVLADVGVDYTSDLEKVERVTLEVAREVMKSVPEAVADFEPLIRFNGFGESSVNFTVVLRARRFEDQFAVRNAFVKKLHERYRKEGITIPFPIRTVHLKQN